MDLMENTDIFIFTSLELKLNISFNYLKYDSKKGGPIDFTRLPKELMMQKKVKNPGLFQVQ